MIQERWKLLKDISRYPAGTELVHDAKAKEWFLPVENELQPIEHAIGKMLDGLIVAPKNWIEKLETNI